MRATVVSVGVFALSVILTGGAAPAGDSGQIPREFSNLQVFPRDTGQPDLVAAMRRFAISLGVRCEHCHVGEGNDLSQFDFASDDKAAKTVARRMLRMTQAINDTYLEGIGGPAPTPKVTCFTCHRGQPKPAGGA